MPYALIKNILITILSHTLSCFKNPKMLLKNIYPKNTLSLSLALLRVSYVKILSSKRYSILRIFCSKSVLLL